MVLVYLWMKNAETFRRRRKTKSEKEEKKRKVDEE